VPAAETTYMCQMFDIPSEGDWHVIGNIPLIDNANVMHHTVVYLCTDEEGEWLCFTAEKG
jgi:dopamine beta-monooxygenase